ncbi:hypothetical protein BV25DRAFT_1915898 [Artomyces pyxidatus]|uniref:Uncharacterized protein n=1 Tax=Artomyces pyxidatus TaxID=48021 RepID=A0ACB8T261_9AGAM|nr:hypothetical protein BV25DRAFT_1915898 [Artomyces pyxidatus]
MQFLSLIVHFFLAQTGNSSPVDNPTTPITVPNALADSSTACDSIHTCRTLYNIIWGALVTILACIWTAVHRNVPRPSRAGESWLRRAAMRVLEAVKIVGVTLLAPEWVLAWAVRQFLNAREVGRELERVRVAAKVEWTARKGGEGGGEDGASGGSEESQAGESGAGAEGGEHIPLTRVSRRAALDGSSLAVHKCIGRLSGKWTTQHGFFVVMGGFHCYDDGEPKHPLSRDDVVQLVKTGDLVPPTEDELVVWSQGDALSKALAVVQTLWFVVQCIARRAEGLPITQLEIMTLAYTTITVAMYAVWWDKPQNVSGPVRVAMPDLKLPEPTPVESKEAWYWHVCYIVIGGHDVFVDLRQERRIPTFYSASTGYNTNNIYHADIIALSAAMVFGAVHCAAWNSEFPSRTQELLWRISSAAIVAVPGAMLVSVLSTMSMAQTTDAGSDSFLLSVLKYILGAVDMVVFFSSGPIYIAARILLLALSFTTLRSLPYDAYRAVQWTLLIPHFT